ncbi:hypothetical protein IFU39_16695 [Paenibacillus sp. CFBP 13594]|uniref:hypothetical protein n=1 Tax=Paenibacillus sp. CFBP 13594 TaxID=2774037 RepID=UPI001781F9F3|nr:hypothetical protein [Paenibacillus sp. CFBP 13594]MBD8839453.1 hypothetical protein [Paenibacillus sp. CFBP 13594]
MDWKLFNENDEFLQEVNCQYDSLDLATMEHDAERVEVDFKNKTARIIKRIEE